MSTLNSTGKVLYKKKMRVGRGIGSGKGKTSGRGVRVKNLDLVLLLKLLKVVKCLYIEDYPKEALMQSRDTKLL